jgi:uncharacterized protein (DUF433 family)
MKSDEVIHDRGRGPEIKGTRITVYSILDYLLEGWPADRIAGWFDVRTHEVEAAIEYLRAHKIEVLKDYIQILERSARGNPPEVQAQLDASHEKFLKLVEEVNQIKGRAEAEIHELIQKHRSAHATDHAHASHHGGQ